MKIDSLSFKQSNTQKGQESESKACLFLESKGYEILARNYRFKRGEIDIITQKDNMLVFVEVKSLKSNYFGFPEQSVTPKKANLVKATAEAYIFDVDWKKNIRFDIIAISGLDFEHFEDAF